MGQALRVKVLSHFQFAFSALHSWLRCELSVSHFCFCASAAFMDSYPLEVYVKINSLIFKLPLVIRFITSTEK